MFLCCFCVLIVGILNLKLNMLPLMVKFSFQELNSSVLQLAFAACLMFIMSLCCV